MSIDGPDFQMIPKALLRSLGVLLISLSSACTLIPGAGPLKSEIVRQGDEPESSVEFALVDITNQTIDTLKQQDGTSLVEALVSRTAPPTLTVGTGDQLAISIWEAGAQPLFSASGSSVATTSGARAAQLPVQTVSPEGTISVPYAGAIEVAGLSLAQVERKIQQALSGKAARPQIIATLAKSVNGSVNVIGDVGQPGRVSLSPARERVIDVLSEAGGVSLPAYEAEITLIRGSSSVSLSLAEVLARPRENVYVFPGDIISVAKQSKAFTVFGATGKNARIAFDSADLNLVEAVALAGGLQDPRANPRGVYLMRHETESLAGQLAGGEARGRSGKYPVVYRLDLSQVGSYFLGREFQVEDGDVLYVANAATTSIRKVLELFGLVSQPIVQGVVFSEAVGD